MIKIEDGILCCEHCGFNYLHQIKVDVFERSGEDSNKGLHVTTQGVMASINTDMEGNPSSRRDGIKITFNCENCDGLTYLYIIQHKGCTYINPDWK
jgi:hypothetical protein